MTDQSPSASSPFVDLIEKTTEAFSNLQEGHIFTEKFEYYAVIAVIRKNLVVIYQGTENELKPICYNSKEAVIKKYAMAQQSGYWVKFLKNDKQFSDKLLNE
jgi:hypothetical protein